MQYFPSALFDIFYTSFRYLYKAEITKMSSLMTLFFHLEVENLRLKISQIFEQYTEKTILENFTEADFSFNYCDKQLESHFAYLIQNMKNVLKIKSMWPHEK